MDWHIVTGSKGGSGKTLLSLILLSKEIQNIDSTTLVLDLNSMNADLSKMLLWNRCLDDSLQLGITEDGTENGVPTGDVMILQKTYSISEHGDSHKFVVGWLNNPYKLCDPAFFGLIIENIKRQITYISRELDTRALRTVLIDTNYHFSNIFSQRAEDYQRYRAIGDDSIYIWFVWVYRQLENLYRGLRGDLAQQQYQGETEQLISVANAIEAHLPNTKCFRGGQNITPFMHVISPVALRFSQPKEPSNGLLKTLYQRFMSDDNDYIEISQLFDLQNLPVSQCVTFDSWVRHLCNVHQSIVRDTNDPHEYFLDVLVEAINTISGQQKSHRPCNIIPLSIYEKKLEGYTDADYSDAMLANLRRFDVYQNFIELFQKNIVD